MPAMTVVTFTDADGDEFPIALPGGWNGSDAELEQEARERIEALSRHGEVRPTLPLSLAGIERP